jgi:hypothetical protein
MRENFQTALIAARRSTAIPESHDVYGWLVGDWDLEALVYKAVEVPHPMGRIHFAWVLEGGTTLRIWNPALQAWDIRWFNPLSSHYESQTGRRIGDEIVQIGARPDGTPTRWRFTEITPTSFHWIGESLKHDGKSWLLEGEFKAKRKP